jgi:hypothetical protein
MLPAEAPRGFAVPDRKQVHRHPLLQAASFAKASRPRRRRRPDIKPSGVRRRKTEAFHHR